MVPSRGAHVRISAGQGKAEAEQTGAGEEQPGATRGAPTRGGAELGPDGPAWGGAKPGPNRPACGRSGLGQTDARRGAEAVV